MLHRTGNRLFIHMDTFLFGLLRYAPRALRDNVDEKIPAVYMFKKIRK